MRYLLFSFILLLFICSCQSGSDIGKVANQIATAETEIGANPDATSEEVNGLLDSYEKYASHPDADKQLAVDYLLRAGDMATRLKNHDRTLKYYDMILKDYPESPKAAKALFMKGFTLDNKMGKLDEARIVYEEFLAKYPDDDFANDAQFSLKNLGKSAEEIIKEFEQNSDGEE